ncbi:protein FAR1-RELATED SEQUENCE 4-like [Beta vulgaris subsp. vulgaris]|uniref:protein FAR1-RELATED SEQUENCE 4-like n=1 Tax=Beta vulgaris subsp. vulgaris TaxID=3555 RepID=UPI002036C5FE|nr:protein FAR1-RELATED SEQUENCE 4-like [Beta vulgaris subsp. vulgaris]
MKICEGEGGEKAAVSTEENSDGNNGPELYEINGEMYVGEGAVVESLHVEGNDIVAVTLEERVTGCRIGEQEGFGVVRASSAFRQKKEGEERKRRNGSWTCECYGKPESKKRVSGSMFVTDSLVSDESGVKKSKKCQCPATIYASLNEDDEWVIRRVVLEHLNHDPTPSKSRHISMYRKEELSNHVRRKLFNDYNSGVKIPQIHDCLARERNGVENWVVTERDLRNEVSKVKRLRLRDGDANAMLEYFNKMTANNQNFFHMHRLDENNYLKDILWVDARSRVAYEEFGDVVCFDSTYLTNEYELPFSNFVGVNHHGQSILLGCALVSHENTETFEWLFRTWLLCMGGKSPGGILTDQCAAMRKALRTSMPNARHRWCLWHITEKFCAKLGMIEGYEYFKDELLNAIYDSLEPEEFEANWSSGILKYKKLSSNEWLAGLYREREMWVPTYLRHMFWAGMKTTQRVESMNSFFDGYVNKHTRLYEFAEHYCEAMEVRANTEKHADANSGRYVRELVTGFAVEKVFQRVYTDSKFKEVQRECNRTIYLMFHGKNVISDNIVEHFVEDRVWIRCRETKKEIPSKKKRTYKIRVDLVLHDVSCSCKLFECHGIICRHTIMAYEMHDKLEVAEKYILRRWRKDVQRKHTRVKVAYHDPLKTDEVRRYDFLMEKFVIICENASVYEENISVCVELLDLLSIRVSESSAMVLRRLNGEEEEDINPSSVGKKKKCTPDSVNKGGLKSKDAEKVNVKDPPCRMLPHRTRDVRFYGAVEKAIKKKSRKGKRVTVTKKKRGTPSLDMHAAG